jgi:hypothetical protein
VTVETLNERAALERPPTAAAVHVEQGLQSAVEQSVVVSWVQRLAAVHQGVELILDTPFIPASYWPLPRVPGVSKLKDWPLPFLKHPQEEPSDYVARRSIAGATAASAALWGEKYGWTPEVSWRHIYVTNGKVGMQYARLRASRFGVRFGQRDETVAELQLRRPGEQEWSPVYRFRMSDAERAGYVPKKGPNASKDWGGNAKYDTDPITMLTARVVAIASRLEASDYLDGVAVAELFDDEPVEVDPNEATAVVERAETRAAREPSTPVEGSARLRELVGAARADGEAEGIEPDAAKLQQIIDRGGVGLSTHSGDDDFPREVKAAAAAQEAAERPDPDAGRDPVTSAQLSKLSAVLGGRHGITGKGSRGERHRIVNAILERPDGQQITSATELTKDEASRVIDVLERVDRQRLYEVIGQPPGEPADDPDPDPVVEPDDAERGRAEQPAEPEQGDPWANPPGGES